MWILTFFLFFGGLFVYIGRRTLFLSPTPASLFMGLGIVAIGTGAMLIIPSAGPSSLFVVVSAAVLALVVASVIFCGAITMGARHSPLMFRSLFDSY